MQRKETGRYWGSYQGNIQESKHTRIKAHKNQGTQESKHARIKARKKERNLNHFSVFGLKHWLGPQQQSKALNHQVVYRVQYNL